MFSICLSAQMLQEKAKLKPFGIRNNRSKIVISGMATSTNKTHLWQEYSMKEVEVEIIHFEDLKQRLLRKQLRCQR